MRPALFLSFVLLAAACGSDDASAPAATACDAYGTACPTGQVCTLAGNARSTTCQAVIDQPKTVTAFCNFDASPVECATGLACISKTGDGKDAQCLRLCRTDTDCAGTTCFAEGITNSGSVTGFCTLPE